MLTRAWKSSGSGSDFGQSSGLIKFSNFSEVQVRVYRVSLLKFGFSGFSGLGIILQKDVNCKLNNFV